MTFVALLRGINITGRHMLPMKSLSALLSGLGCVNVRTYLQSGNAVFECADADAVAIATAVTRGVEKAHGFAPHVIVLRQDAIDRAVARNPFPQADVDPRTLHLFFLDAEPASPRIDAMESLVANGERFTIDGRVFYLYTPNGFGISKLAARAERLLGVPATARNWRTVQAVASMMRDAAAAQPRSPVRPSSGDTLGASTEGAVDTDKQNETNDQSETTGGTTLERAAEVVGQALGRVAGVVEATVAKVTPKTLKLPKRIAKKPVASRAATRTATAKRATAKRPSAKRASAKRAASRSTPTRAAQRGSARVSGRRTGAGRPAVRRKTGGRAGSGRGTPARRPGKTTTRARKRTRK